MIIVGSPQSPLVVGNGGFSRGSDFLPSIVFKIVVSSPQIYPPFSGFTKIPTCLAEAAGRMVAVQYRRRQWLGQVSQMQPGVGTTSYSRLETELDTKAVIERYKTRFMPN